VIRGETAGVSRKFLGVKILGRSSLNIEQPEAGRKERKGTFILRHVEEQKRTKHLKNPHGQNLRRNGRRKTASTKKMLQNLRRGKSA